MVLAVGCSLTTLLLIGALFIPSQIEYDVLRTLVRRTVGSLDIFIAIFAVYSHFGFGERLYFQICKCCHLQLEYRWINAIRSIKYTSNSSRKEQTKEETCPTNTISLTNNVTA